MPPHNFRTSTEIGCVVMLETVDAQTARHRHGQDMEKDIASMHQLGCMQKPGPATYPVPDYEFRFAPDRMLLIIKS